MLPRFGDVEEVMAIHRLRVVANWSGFRARRSSRTAVFNPEPGWVVIDTRVIRHSSNNGSRSISTAAGGLDLVSEEVVKEVYKEAIEAAGRYNDDRLEGSLKTEMDNRLKEIFRLRTTKNTIIARVSARAHGSFVNRKRGWEEISVRARVRYLGAPSEEELLAELEDAYRIDINVPVQSEVSEMITTFSRLPEGKLPVETRQAEDIVEEWVSNEQ